MNKFFTPCFEYKVIYVFRINLETHKNALKIGDTTLRTNTPIDELKENSKELNEVAKKRIKEYTNTVGISFELLHTELAVYNHNVELKSFRDYQVHNVLENSGINKKNFSGTTGREWFEVDLETVIASIKAVKNNEKNLSNQNIKPIKQKIILRPEQEEAIKKTKEVFKNNNKMLWNAKMRFGKTITALQLIKEKKFKKSIIITHRPVVDNGWYEDFKKIFTNGDYIYGSKNTGYQDIKELLEINKNFIYFASIQDLRGSDTIGGKFSKNQAIFDLDWDFLIVDEAHEGTKTNLGEEVIKNILKEKTKYLTLSGTPFNILGDYEKDNIYTWDYVMEQKAKTNWNIENFGDSNPYDELPELKIFTYDIGKMISKNLYNQLENKAFNFKEFFRVYTNEDSNKIPNNKNFGDFIHEEDIISFLNLITKEDKNSNYPFSNEEYRNLFKHTLWVLPGVKEAKALSKLLKSHSVFGNGSFNIVNVAGDGDEEEESKDALEKVQTAIANADDSYTITLSCGRLTTGVTIPEWTAVFMLSGSHSTSASTYLQTIFRVQSPCNKDGMIKKYCYVFDFAPDRALKMIAHSIAISTKAGKTQENDRKILGEFLNFCPVISIDGTSMRLYDTTKLLRQLKKVYAEKVVSSGFEDSKLYNDELLKLTDVEIKDFKEISKILGSSKSQGNLKNITINEQGFTEEEYEKLKQKDKKKKSSLTEEEKIALEEFKNLNENKKNAIKILRAISIRMPLIIYGADIPVEKDLHIEDFLNSEIIDDKSWEEFMPKKVTRELFKKFIKYYDKEIFIEAGKKIRDTTKQADTLPILDRIKVITDLFSTFKNPDKETVLTPWRVVNMHLGDCLGGYNFFDLEYNMPIDKPRYINQGKVTEDTLSNINAKILEINSKTGLYPLYIAYSIFMERCSKYNDEELTKDLEEELWKETIENNIFVICKTSMAKQITNRTLSGFKNITVKSHYFDNIVNMMQNKSKQFIEKVLNPKYWKEAKEKEMKFDAVVGNPPYQENIGGKNNESLAKQLFPYFIINSIELNPNYVSLITPSRWFTGDAQDKSFLRLRKYLKENNHFLKIFNYKNEKDLFKTVEIKGGINYFLFSSKYNGKVEFTNYYNNIYETYLRNLFEESLDIIIVDNNYFPIIEKVKKNNFISITKITKGRNAFGIVGKENIVNEISKETYFENSSPLRCKNNIIRYINPDIIKKGYNIFTKYKVFISKSAGDPKSDFKIIGTPYIAEPFSACTDSLIPIGEFETFEEAFNLHNYLKTKFVRLLISTLKSSQNVYQNVYEFVPLQDFTNNSDINWNVSIPEIDKQLYKKYNLTEEEIYFIENKIKPM